LPSGVSNYGNNGLAEINRAITSAQHASVQMAANINEESRLRMNQASVGNAAACPTNNREAQQDPAESSNIIEQSDFLE